MNRRSSGFTIIELLIVIVVIAILAAITIVAYNGITAKAHMAALQSSLSQSATSLAATYTVSGTYPATQAAANLPASGGDTLSYNVSADGLSYCLQDAGWSISYFVTSQQNNPVQGTCNGTTGVPGSSSTPAPTPTIVGSSATSTNGYGGSYTPVLQTSASTKTGNLVIIAAYVEPANEGTSSATFGTITTPSGVSLLPGFPVETDASDMTTGDDHRLYAWYYYATANGSQTLTFTDTQDVYWGLTSVSISGGPTSGNPLADAASTNYWSRTSPSVGHTPNVSLNLGGQNSLVLWITGDWDGGEPAQPSGFNTVVTSTNWSGQPAITANTYSAAGSTGIITGAQSSTDNGITVALLSFRG